MLNMFFNKNNIMKNYKKKFYNIKKLIRNPAPVIVEIGAHYGEDTLRFKHIFPDSSLHCFEPDPRNISIFKKYVRLNKVFLYELALSNKIGKKNFYQSFNEDKVYKVPEKYDWISLEEYNLLKLNNSGSSSLKKGYQKILSETIVVGTERFDNWAKNHNIGLIDLVWIDVQGAEGDVIEGMGEKIKSINYVWIEYGEKAYEDALSREETIKIFEDKGFYLVNHLSSKHQTGDLLFSRKKINLLKYFFQIL
tara:strand:- start:569 stop:1318 length:750 start_codon:yes stop_codon:yes gene_type:complete